MDRNFALPPIGKAAIVFAVALATLVPLIAAVGVLRETAQGGLQAAAGLAALGLVSVVVLSLLLPMWRREVAFDGRRIRVKATFYTREATLAQLELDKARIVDLRERTGLRPLFKTNGFALPGFHAGHFRLREDRRKAFCLVTDQTRVLLLPHVDGSLWLLSFEHPQAVLDILRRAAA
jgi:hypothetical protein